MIFKDYADMDIIKCVVFDLGWTLFDEDYRWFKTCNWMSDTLRAFGIFHEPDAIKIKYEACCGRPDPYINSITRQCLIELGLQTNIVDTLCKHHPWHTWEFFPYEGSKDLLTCLKENGIKIGVVSNQGKFTRDILKKHKFDEFCDFIFLSEEEGILKPDPKFFEMAITASAVNDPIEIVYFGDRIDHDVIPSQKAGMQAALVLQGPHRLQKMRTSPDYIFRSISEVTNAIRPISEGKIRLTKSTNFART